MRNRIAWPFAALACVALGACASVEHVPPRVGLAPVDGGEIEYVVSGPADGEPLLLIAGGGLATALSLVQAEPALADYRVIRMHRRGYAGSSPAELEDLSMSELAADAVGVLNALDVERAHVAGHSFGAAVAMQMAADRPDRVASIVLLDPYVPVGFGPAPPPPPNGAPAFNPLAAARVRAQALLAAGDPEGAIGAFYGFILGDDWRDYFEAVPGGLAMAVADAPFDLGGDPPPWEFGRAQIATIRQPVLVLRGAESPIWPEPAAANLVAAFPDAAGAAIEDTDHALITQKPDEVAEAIGAFLAHHPM